MVASYKYRPFLRFPRSSLKLSKMFAIHKVHLTGEKKLNETFKKYSVFIEATTI